MFFWKRNLSFLVLINAAIATAAQTSRGYFHPKFDSITREHKSIAILPFEVVLNLRPLERKQLKDSEFQSLQKQEGLIIQKTLDAYMFKKRTKRAINIEIQETDSTNKLLRAKRWSSDSITKKSKKELTSLLGVDAVFYGTFHVNRPVATHVAGTLQDITGIPLSNIAGECVIYLFDGKSGALLWQFWRHFSQGSRATIDSVIEAVMRSAARNIPYSNK